MFRLAAAVLASGEHKELNGRGGGDGLIREPVAIPEEQGVALGDLYFKSPTLRWEAGTHRSRKGPHRAADTPRVMRTNSCSG